MTIRASSEGYEKFDTRQQKSIKKELLVVGSRNTLMSKEVNTWRLT
ncbi:uncharacterized protein G2W53_039283 [Senna tora]|uniref:Uncharacterized protein n=1 Tax=Senna tora TaxID=362788 RepID=A0A834ST38_9FABA|nr:uncharacterized protein G2W53_039283 [Senna tora]